MAQPANGGAILFVFISCAILFGSAAVGCRSGAGPDPVSATGEGLEGGTPSVESLNERLVARLSLASDPGERSVADYRVGHGDVLEITIFQAEELNRTVRVRSDGSISLPLLGLLKVAGETAGELEDVLESRLGAGYLKNPQVSVFVKEHRAHSVSVLGKVNKPGVYYLRRPRTLLEILSEAGGLTQEAGTMVQLRRERVQRGSPDIQLMTIDIRRLLEGENRGLDLTLMDDDTIYVPKAGVVFVEGAVAKPGAYPLHGAGTVLKAVVLAGGLEFSARDSAVQVIRKNGSQSEVIPVDLGAIRRDPSADVSVFDGDVVVVASNPLKAGLATFWRGIAGVMRVTTGL